jgi:hypothetical protein
MEKTQTNKQRMFNAVMEVLMQYLSVWQTNLGLKELVDQLKVNNDALSAIRSSADVNTKGITIDKDVIKLDVIKSIMIVAGPLSTAVGRKGNNELKVRLKFSDSVLDDMPEQELADTGAEVVKIANEHIEDAKKFGVTDSEIKHLDEVSTSFDAILPKGRTTVSVRKASKESRRGIIKDSTFLLYDEIDGVIENYREKSPEFWNAYNNARKVVDYGVRHEKSPKTQDPKATASAVATTSNETKEEGK